MHARYILLILAMVMLTIPASSWNPEDGWDGIGDGWWNTSEYGQGVTAYHTNPAEDTFSGVRNGAGTSKVDYPDMFLNLTAGTVPDQFVEMSRPTIFQSDYWPMQMRIHDIYLEATIETYSTLGDFTLVLTSGNGTFADASAYESFYDILLSDNNITITTNGTHHIVFKLNDAGRAHFIEERDIDGGVVGSDYAAEFYIRFKWDVDNKFDGTWQSGGVANVTFPNTSVPGVSNGVTTWINMSVSEPPKVEDTFDISATNGTHISPPWPVQFWDTSGLTNQSTYYWDFGDGATSTQKNPVHTYTTTGVFNVTFRIVDSNGGIYEAIKPGFVFSRKNGLPVPFDGFSDEFDMPESIILYNGTTPISKHWHMITYEGKSVLNATNDWDTTTIDGSLFNASAIFYAPPWLNGSSQLHYKFPAESTYTFNFIRRWDDCGIYYFPIQWWGRSFLGYYEWDYDSFYPSQYYDRMANLTSWCGHKWWIRTAGGAYEFWFSQDQLRSRIMAVEILPSGIVHNFTEQVVVLDPTPPESRYMYLFIDNAYMDEIALNSYNFTYGFAGFSIVNYQMDMWCGEVDPSHETQIMFDNWSINYQDAPEAAFTYSSTNDSTWWRTTGTTVKFTDASNNAGFAETGWYWEFGDGSVSYEQNPTHIYTTPGTYAVNMRVETSEGFDWVLGETTIEATKTVSPWEDSSRTADMIQNTIFMGIIVIILATVAVLIVTTMNKHG